MLSTLTLSMSVPPSSGQYMATALWNTSTPERESFHKFFELWLSEQNQHLQELISASKDHCNRNGNTTSNSQPNQDVSESVLRQLVEKVVQHYEHYYRAKSRWAKQDVLPILSPSWRSTLEDAFLWIGGWRPSMAFHLLYSKSGLQLEAGLAKLLNGLTTGDLGDLSPSQLRQVDELQRKTIREEKQLTEKMAKLQESVADTSMVELSHAATELISNGEANGNGNELDGKIESTLTSKEEGLEEILHRADDLRLRTLKSVVELLNTIQAVHFLIAAAELHLRLREWGKKRDATEHHANGVAGDRQH